MQGRRPPSTYNLSSINHPMNSAAMEQIAKYWGMRGVRRTTSTSSTDESLIIPWAAAAASAAYSSSEPSWEEQAFARDAATNLVWPPRSYSCTFCHREFRSAQALGGHMNVHRRDRARLRQGESPSPDDNVQEALPHDQNQPHQDSFMYRAISNLSATIIEESKNKVVTSKSMSLAARDQEAIDQYDHNDEKEESGRTKRKRVDQPAVALPIFVRSMAVAALVVAPQGFDPDAKVHKTTASPSSSSPGLVDQQEVDLELRLGITPKVS